MRTIEEAIERLRALESELTVLRQELDHTQRLASIGTIAAGVAHEVNNLLTPALAYAQAASLDPSNTHLQERALRGTIDGITSASHILQAILDFSALSHEGAVCEVDEVLQAAVDCLGRDLDRADVELVRRIPPQTRVAVPPLSLQQVLLNLLLNAVRVLSEGGGRIVVTAETGPTGRTVISVEDNGPGVHPDVADTLFEPFVSLALARSTAAEGGGSRRGGSGLGLTMCRRTLEAAGGAISVETTPGGGATFRLDVPTAEARPRARAG